jgi:hypothetical protein
MQLANMRMIQRANGLDFFLPTITFDAPLADLLHGADGPALSMLRSNHKSYGAMAEDAVPTQVQLINLVDSVCGASI